MTIKSLILGMDYIRQKLKIFGQDIIFTRHHVSYPAMPVVMSYSRSNPSLQLQPPTTHNGLNDACCPDPDGACIGSLGTLPNRLAYDCSLRQLVYCQLEPLYCNEPGCNSPHCNRNAVRDLVVERTDQVVNWLNSQKPLEWTEHCLFHDYLGVTRIFYQIRHRYQQRMRGGCRPRRNYINVLVLHPYHNAFRFIHTTYKKAPCPVEGMMPVLTRILNEAADLCTESALKQPGYYCKCGPQLQPAVPKDYMKQDLRPKAYDYTLNKDSEKDSSEVDSVPPSGPIIVRKRAPTATVTSVGQGNANMQVEANGKTAPRPDFNKSLANRLSLTHRKRAPTATVTSDVPNCSQEPNTVKKKNKLTLSQEAREIQRKQYSVISQPTVGAIAETITCAQPDNKSEVKKCGAIPEFSMINNGWGWLFSQMEPSQSETDPCQVPSKSIFSRLYDSISDCVSPAYKDDSDIMLNWSPSPQRPVNATGIVIPQTPLPSVDDDLSMDSSLDELLMVNDFDPASMGLYSQDDSIPTQSPDVPCSLMPTRINGSGNVDLEGNIEDWIRGTDSECEDYLFDCFLLDDLNSEPTSWD